MTVEEFYNLTGGSYETMLKRVPSPDKVIRFVNMYLADKNFEALTVAMEEDNKENAFAAAHNLKGIASNLAFERLAGESSEITEALRSGNMEKAREYRERLRNLEYNRRTQTGIIDDAYENPLEKEIRYSSMEALKEEIIHERNSTAESLQYDSISKTVENNKTLETSDYVRSR